LFPQTKYYIIVVSWSEEGFEDAFLRCYFIFFKLSAGNGL
jgi:hypothetical protein